VTSSTLTVLTVDINDAGTYRCVVTADCGAVTSNEAILTLKTTVAADFDQDCDVDPADYDLFAACISGPGASHASECSTEDLDIDEDVDQVDFGLFQRCYSGENVPPDPNCAN
jgi:hypothetical protein